MLSDAAVASIVTGFITIIGMVIGFLKLWVDIKYGVKKKVEEASSKIDQNTLITQAGTQKAVLTADRAATTAETTKATVEDISRKLNGSMDEVISTAIAPIVKTIEEHAASDDKYMREINTRFEHLTNYVHERNHDILSAINAQSLKLDAAMVEIKSIRGTG